MGGRPTQKTAPIFLSRSDSSSAAAARSVAVRLGPVAAAEGGSGGSSSAVVAGRTPSFTSAIKGLEVAPLLRGPNAGQRASIGCVAPAKYRDRVRTLNKSGILINQESPNLLR